MIVRIVKMTFRVDSDELFKEYTKEIRETIRNFDGCKDLDIYRDIHNPTIFFSYSHWESEEHLERYRESDFFRTTWAKTKKWFGDKPAAWTIEKI
jgi:quinol monooxygenase YgiN